MGKRLDSLTHRLVIERVGVEAIDASCPVYYCIGCDKDVKNIARGRSLPHAYSCMVSGTECSIHYLGFKDTCRILY